ncbi:MAG: molybdopterin biosynthesis protein [Deltaproteobacteria bacterium]|nr:molybdopterin biosynthesis protein [Deltaproteobacteria bacterium]
MKDAAEAWETLRARVRLANPLPEDEVDVAAAAGRVSARPMFAALSSPFYHGAAMDGFAVRAEGTVGASEIAPVRLCLGKDAVPVDTGDPIPRGHDAVIKIEDVHEPEPGILEIVSSVAPWQNVRLTGEDVVTGELVVPQGKLLTAFDVGALLAAGLTRTWVRRRPRVALIPTGDELVEPGAPVSPGHIIEFNTHVLSALVREWGGEPTRIPPVRDDPSALEAAVRDVLKACDIVVMNAGASAGRDDHTPFILASLGELLVHGINVMPGKPTAVGVTNEGQPILGLPGYPVSCAVAAEKLLRPLIALFLGVAPLARERVRARVARKIPSKVGHEEVIRVQAGRIDGGWTCSPLARGAGVITSLSRANALLIIPPLVEGVEAGEEVDVELLVPRTEAELTLVHVGSHDLALDLAGDLLRRHHPGRSLASANVGSLGGLYALSRGECHFAGTHLIDPATGEYNVPHVRRACPRKRVALVGLVEREQGFTVARGNPKGIRDFPDLLRDDVTFVNRQRGAGTRVLLDTRLAERRLDPSGIRGYEREEYTHMAAAVAVSSGVADCALTIRAAADALGLDFVPLEREPYDLAIPVDSLDTPHLRAMLGTIRSPEFRRAAEKLGGYSAARAGALVGEVSR